MYIHFRFVVKKTYDLYNEEFMHFVSKYKFVISIENSACYDYITEKLWRPLIVGSVPVYLGSPTIEVSVLVLENFQKFLTSLLANFKTQNNLRIGCRTKKQQY